MTHTSLWPLRPLVPVYRAAQALDSLTYARGWRGVEQLACPVISVGNLSVGGAGKTPFVITLAHALTERGWNVDVLSRGYGRTSRAIEQVNLAAPGDLAARYGDEPWFISQAAQVPVFVGADRAAAGRLAEVTLSGAHCVHVLDDGLQHRRLARDVEIVLLHRTDFATTLLPAGRLREPLSALRRADFVVLRDEDAKLAPRAQQWMSAGATIWRVRRALELPVLPGPAVVFSAIAHPAEFVAGVRSRGASVAGQHLWRDHHRYTAADLAILHRTMTENGGACFVTTEKDAARLTVAQRATLEASAPLLVAKLTAHLLQPEPALEALEARLAAAASRKTL